MITILTYFLGGLGLLLLGMWLITQGLKTASGPRLRSRLANWTSTNARSLLTGFTLTAAAQSSGLATTATLGFVNAQLLSLERGIWVIYGSNLGSILSAWVAAFIGLGLNIQGFALVLIGFGMLLRLWRNKNGAQGLGIMIAGLGCFFFALNTLKSAFTTPDLNFLPSVISDNGGFVSLILGLLFGIGLAVLMQSSTATIILLLTAASNQTISQFFAAAGVIGANIGTTSTIVLASLGATPNAKRLAAVHVLFNVSSGLVAFLLLIPFLWLSSGLSAFLNGGGNAAISLAIFNTFINILGLLLMWPVTGRMLRVLQQRWRELPDANNKQKLQYIDKHAFVIPAVALKSFSLETQQLGKDLLHEVQEILKGQRPPQIKLQQLHERIELIRQSANLLTQSALPKEVSEKLPILLRALIHYQMLLEHLQTDIPIFSPTSLPAELNDIYQQISLYVAEIIRLGLQEFTTADFAKMTINWKSLAEQYQLLKRKTLQITAEGTLAISASDQLLRHLETLYIIADRTMRASERLLTTTNEAAVKVKS